MFRQNILSRWQVLGFGLLLLAATNLVQAAGSQFVAWEAKLDAIPTPLAGLKGNPARGRTLAKDGDKGNCLTCHQLPIAEEAFQGTIGPPLAGVGARLTAGQLRLRIADETRLNPATVMPAFYRDPKTLYSVLDEYYGKTMLSAQEVEDIVAYLLTLK